MSKQLRSPPDSLPLKGQVTRHTTVKWPIQNPALSKCFVAVGSIEEAVKAENTRSPCLVEGS